MLMLTPKQASERTGGTVSADFIRSACRRGSFQHRLPSVNTGKRRHAWKIPAEVFDRWLEEEASGRW